MKLIQECADLQAQLEAMAPRLRGLAQLEERHAAMEAPVARDWLQVAGIGMYRGIGGYRVWYGYRVIMGHIV